MIITLWAHMGAHWEHIERAPIDENFVGTHWEHEDRRNVFVCSSFSSSSRYVQISSWGIRRRRVEQQQQLLSGERERTPTIGSFFLLQFLDLMMMLASNIFGHFAFQNRLQSHMHTFDWIWLCMVSNFRVPFRLEVSSCCWACSSCCNKGRCRCWSHWRGGGGGGRQCRIHRPQVLQDFYSPFLFWDSLFVCVCVCVCVCMVT